MNNNIIMRAKESQCLIVGHLVLPTARWQPAQSNQPEGEMKWESQRPAISLLLGQLCLSMMVFRIAVLFTVPENSNNPQRSQQSLIQPFFTAGTKLLVPHINYGCQLIKYFSWLIIYFFMRQYDGLKFKFKCKILTDWSISYIFQKSNCQFCFHGTGKLVYVHQGKLLFKFHSVISSFSNKPEAKQSQK